MCDGGVVGWNNGVRVNIEYWSLKTVNNVLIFVRSRSIIYHIYVCIIIIMGCALF